MVKVARYTLRQAFLEADMGISGANFAIAESTIGIVSNEGNARLTTTLPRAHVALIGIDKLVPDLTTALNILKALPRNATGQAISTYVTWITGATECGLRIPAKKKCTLYFWITDARKLPKTRYFPKHFAVSAAEPAQTSVRFIAYLAVTLTVMFISVLFD